jgi:protein-histidine pros-kinase
MSLNDIGIQTMRLQTRFSLALLALSVAGFGLSVGVTYRVLLANAKDEVLRNGALMMETALAVRSYTVDEIKPHLDPLLAREFLPQTVPAYSAVETFTRLQKKYPEYSYREAALNPTNPRDLGNSWETAIIRGFRERDAKEVVGERRTVTGTSLYIARPIRITNAACLGCHSTPEAAPASLIARYGDKNGFGWQHNEIIGAQIVTVPMNLAEKSAVQAFWAFASVLAGIFAAIFLVVNLMLSRLVITPLRRIALGSEEISKGNLDLAEFPERGAEEIRNLEASFNRLRRSVEKAMRSAQIQK